MEIPQLIFYFLYLPTQTIRHSLQIYSILIRIKPIKIENKQTDTTYPLKKPNKNPNPLSIDPTPVQVTALLSDLPINIIKKKIKIKIAIHSPTLLINSDSIYSLTTG